MEVESHDHLKLAAALSSLDALSLCTSCICDVEASPSHCFPGMPIPETALVVARRRLRTRKKARPRPAKMAPAATPAPIAALAPVERPPGVVDGDAALSDVVVLAASGKEKFAVMTAPANATSVVSGFALTMVVLSGLMTLDERSAHPGRDVVHTHPYVV